MKYLVRFECSGCKSGKWPLVNRWINNYLDSGLFHLKASLMCGECMHLGTSHLLTVIDKSVLRSSVVEHLNDSINEICRMCGGHIWMLQTVSYLDSRVQLVMRCESCYVVRGPYTGGIMRINIPEGVHACELVGKTFRNTGRSSGVKAFF